MNRIATFAIAIVAAGAVASPAHALPAPDPVPAGMTVTASVDCSLFNIDITGLQPNTRVMVELGDEPTYGFDFQGEHPETWQFTVTDDGHATADLPILSEHQGTVFMTAIGIIDIATGAAAWPFYQDVDCRVAVAEPVALPALSEIDLPIVAETPTPAVDVEALWVDVADAPPW